MRMSRNASDPTCPAIRSAFRRAARGSREAGGSRQEARRLGWHIINLSYKDKNLSA